ncbi:hypothetical protein ACF0H5_007001 [Mactra antiquata]
MLDVSIRPHILDVVCEQQYPRNICDYLPDNVEENKLVQANTGMYLTLYRVLINVPGLFIGLFFGAWCDTNGRKLPMTIPCVGNILAVVVYIVSKQFKHWALVILLVGAFIQGLFGRNAVVTIAVNSYTAENSKTEVRTVFLGRLLAMQYFGKCVGAMLSGIMDFNIIASFGLAGGIHLVGLLLVVFGIKETPRDESNNKEEQDKNAEHLNTENYFLKGIRAFLQNLTKLKSRNDRFFVILIVIISLSNGIQSLTHPDLLLLVVTGDSFKWSTAEYSYLISYEHVAMGISLFIILPFLSNFLELSDFDTMILGFVCRLIFSVFIQFALEYWSMYLLIAIWSVSGIIRNCIRSILSKSVDNNDLGKMFSLLTCVDAASKILGPLIYLNIYSATLSINKWIVFYIMAASGVIDLVLVIFVKVRYKKLTRGTDITALITVDEESHEENVDNGDYNDEINNQSSESAVGTIL